MARQDGIRWFGDIRLDDVALVGGKTASLGELYSVLSSQGINVPNGFALTAQAYRDALTAAGAWRQLHELLDDLDKRQIAVLAARAAAARKIVYEATGTAEMRELVADGIPAPRGRNTGGMWRWRRAARPQPKTCPAQASRASMKAS